METRECSHATGAHDEPCDLVAGLMREVDGLRAQSESRLKALMDKAEEAKREWIRAENAEGQIVKAMALLKPACAEESLEGAIRNLQHAHSLEYECGVRAAARIAELARFLGTERCSECRRPYAVDPATGERCYLADHVEAYAAISGKVG
jgi:hypothetical protein